MLFLENGHDVITCNSGREALAWCDLVSPDVAIIDTRLPDINGLDLLDSMRQRFPGFQAIVIIPQGDEEAWTGAEKRGASAWIEEPLDLEDLEIALERVARPETASSRKSGTEKSPQTDTVTRRPAPGPQSRTIEQEEGG